MGGGFKEEAGKLRLCGGGGAEAASWPCSQAAGPRDPLIVPPAPPARPEAAAVRAACVNAAW